MCQVPKVKIDPETGKEKIVKCGAPARQVDHIRQDQNDNHDLSNLRSICDYDHGQKSAAEGHAARRAKNQPKKREIRIPRRTSASLDSRPLERHTEPDNKEPQPDS